MRAIRTAAVVALAFLAACADQDVNQLTAPPSVAVLPGPALSLSGQTSDSAAIEGLILQLYSNLNNGNGPLNSAQTRFRQVAALYTNCNLNPPASPCNQAGAQDNTYSLITDIFARYKAGGLNALPSYSSASGTGTGAAVTDLTNLLLQYVGLESDVCSFGTGVDCDATVYQPGSPAQILSSPSGLAGVSLPAGTGTVTRATVISVSRIPDPNFRLTTSLDQYAYRYLYTSSSGQGLSPEDPFLQEVTVEVCLAAGQTFPAGALERLVLAHDVSEPEPYENIQILPSGTAFLTGCAALAAAEARPATLAGRAWEAVSGAIASVLSPSPLNAWILATTTGTVGRTKTLSPFGAVDPIGYLVPVSATSSVAPVGGTVAAPNVRVVTPSQLAEANPTGPGMADIPVTFTVTAGGGCLANPCASGSPTTLTVNTDASGYAAVPAWTVGLGVNTVSVSADIPCPAPVVAGSTANCGTIVTTGGDASLVFSATGMPPTQVGFAPATLTILTGLQGGYAPGVPFNVTVLVQDGEVPPQTVPGSSASVALTIVGGTLVCPSGCTQTAVNGVATFTGVYVTSTGSFTLTATSTGLTSAPASPTGGITSVAPPSSAANIAINAGDNQTAAEGTTLGTAAGTVAPSVRVTDAYGNLVGGAGVSFAVASGAGSVGSPAAATSALGIASTTWTIVAGTNTLNAYITALGTANAVGFTATGTSVSKELLACSPASGSGDELTKAFYWTPKNGSKTMKQVTLYLASNDPANVPTPFTITLKATSNGFGGTVLGTSTQTVYLRGSASQNLATQFTFPNVSLPSGSDKKVYFQFVVGTNPNGVKLTFAKSATTCDAITKTSGPSSTTSIGKGVGIKILGS